MPSARILAFSALAALGVSCHSGPPAAIDPALAARVPPSATIVAGAHPGRIRASPLHDKLPPAALAFLDSLGTAGPALLASDGSNYVVLKGGGQPAVGSPDWVRYAASPPRQSANALLPYAAPVAAFDIWMVAAGNANLPLTGNAENVTRMLHATEYTTLTAKIADQIALDITGVCRDAATGQHLEETLRAFLMLGAAGAKRDPQLVDLLKRVKVTRDDRVVRVALNADPAALRAIF